MYGPPLSEAGYVAVLFVYLLINRVPVSPSTETRQVGAGIRPTAGDPESNRINHPGRWVWSSGEPEMFAMQTVCIVDMGLGSDTLLAILTMAPESEGICSVIDQDTFYAEVGRLAQSA